MIPIDETTRARFLSEALQGVRMDVHPVLGEDLALTEANIMQGTFALDRRSSFGDTVGIGTVCADELSFVLNDPDGAFRAAGLEGAELHVRMTVTESDVAESLQRPLPIGYFTVDDVTRGQDNLTVTALDRMVQFDQDFVMPDDPAAVGTVPKMLEYLCTLCRVPLAETDYTDVPNIDYPLSLPEDGAVYTCRQMLSWVCEIAGACARMDWEGKLRLEWFTDADVALTPANRFSSDLAANTVTITGVKATVGETDILVGSGEYALSIEGNPLLGEDAQAAQTAISAIGARVIGFSYTPFEASVLPMPFVLPLDVLSFEDAEGISHRVAVTEVSFCLNRSTVLRGVGQSSTKKSYARADPLTNRERVVLSQMQKQINRRLDGMEQSAIEFDKVISGALGLYQTYVTLEDGSVVRYLHDRPTLEMSQVIFTWNAGGIAVTESGWNGGKPVWEHGTTAAGDGLFRYLAADRIDARWIKIENQTLTEYIGDSVDGSVADATQALGARISSLEVDNGGIRASVAKTQAQLENMQIGGRNLYQGTKDFSGDKWVDKDAYWIRTDETYRGFTVYRRKGAYGGLGQNIHVEAGETYTFSGWVRTDSETAKIRAIYVSVSGSNLNATLSVNQAYYEVDSNWQRICLTFEVLSTGNIRPRIEAPDSDDTTYVCGLQLERGNMVTDWTPSPEDAEMEISSVQASIEMLEGSITSKVTAVEKNIASVETRTSAVEQRADSIELSVSATKNAVDSLKIVGRNLYQGTKDFSGDKWVDKDAYWIRTDEIYRGFTVYRRKGAYGGLGQNIHVEAGETYTFSGWVRTDSETAKIRAIYVSVSGSNLNATLSVNQAYYEVDSNWQRICLTFEVLSAGNIRPRIEAPDSDDTTYVCGLKLERGNMVTDWTPSPEDGEVDILPAQASIEILEYSIASKVSKGKLSSEISQEAGAISIKSNRLTIDSDNFKLAADGTVTANNVNLSGAFETSETYGSGVSIKEGQINMKFRGDDLLTLTTANDLAIISSEASGLQIQTGTSLTDWKSRYYQGWPDEQTGIAHRFTGGVEIEGNLTVTGTINGSSGSGSGGTLPRRIALHADGMYPTIFRHSDLSGYEYTPVGGEILIAPDANAIYRYHTYSGANARVYVYQPRRNGVTVNKGGAYVSAIMGNFTGYSAGVPPTTSTVGDTVSSTDPGADNFVNDNNSLFRGSPFALVASFQMTGPWASRDSVYTYLSNHKGEFPMLNIGADPDELLIIVRAEVKLPTSGTAQILSNYIDNGGVVFVDNTKRFDYWASGCWYDYPNSNRIGPQFTADTNTHTWTVYMAEEFGGAGFDLRVRVGSTDYNPGGYIQSASGGEWVYEAPLADNSWNIAIEASSDTIRTVSGDSSLSYDTLDQYAKPGDIHIKTPSSLLTALTQTQIWRCKYARFGQNKQVWEKIF